VCWCTADAHSAAPRLWPVIMMLNYSLYAMHLPSIHAWTPSGHAHEQDSKLDNGELVPKEALGLRHDELEVVHISSSSVVQPHATTTSSVGHKLRRYTVGQQCPLIVAWRPITSGVAAG
jgi:hypothetical protein